MGLFDIFGTGDQQAAAQAQISGLQAANQQATSAINSGTNTLNTQYTAALQPYLQNYSQAQPGVQQLGNVLGLNGANGNKTAQQTLQATPGFAFQQQQGNNAINAQAAATGMAGSGNQALALSNYNQGLAGTTYNNYVSQLQPYLQASQNAAGGIANVNTGLGNAVNQNQNTLANLDWATQTGIGNANANADLAGLTASANGINAIGQGLKLATSIFSDVRLKEDIEPIGELYDGTNVYRYRYKGDDTPRIGVMAQEVEKSRPDAVVEIGGYKAVDYSKATDLAASLARFVGDNVVQLDDHRPVKSEPSYVGDLSRFLEAA